MYGMGQQKPERNFAESPKLIPDMEDPISWEKKLKEKKERYSEYKSSAYPF